RLVADRGPVDADAATVAGVLEGDEPALDVAAGSRGQLDPGVVVQLARRAGRTRDRVDVQDEARALVPAEHLDDGVGAGGPVDAGEVLERLVVPVDLDGLAALERHVPQRDGAVR